MDVRLEDNKLVLVGENGTGKSTFANLIYYFLTKQWSRLQEYRFVRLHAQIGDRELVLTPEHIQQHLAMTQHLRGIFGDVTGRAFRHRSVTHNLVNRLAQWQLMETPESDESVAKELALELHMPRSMVLNLLQEYREETKGKPTHIQTLEHILSSLQLGQFLYLPTYRRIEQDLRSIFRGADIEGELRKFRERLGRRTGAPFIELVEFGMEDVEQTITDRMAQTEKSVRKGLDNLTGTYLRDVIRGVHTKVDVTAADKLDSKALDAVFARIDEATLPSTDKKNLQEKVAAISSSHAIEEQDKVTAHFLLKLIDLNTEQQANEKDVRDFVRLCNKYLTGKQIVYDNTKYTMFVQQISDSIAGDESTLEMRSLSSGEKQIVSLFSHLYLSGQPHFFLIIDEPELSLSVPWQREFLPDILGTGMCTGLIAVTHSPFVWENSLEPYVRPLAEFSTAYLSTTSN